MSLSVCACVCAVCVCVCVSNVYTCCYKTQLLTFMCQLFSFSLWSLMVAFKDFYKAIIIYYLFCDSLRINDIKTKNDLAMF